MAQTPCLCRSGQTAQKAWLQSRDRASITNKLKRGTFSATFFLACIAVMELDGLALDENLGGTFE
jgi:uncharacterized protein YecT (DUF1311 family)